MKKVISLLSLLLVMSFAVQAQVNPRALGLRFGGNGDVNGAELSYQHALGESNRLEFDLGFGSGDKHSRTYVVGMYHWVNNLAGGLNWFIGPGAVAGLYNDDGEGYINIGLGGQIGLEYDFNIPLLISLDARPMWNFLGDNGGFGWGASLGLRYTW